MMTHRKNYLMKYFHSKPDKPPKFNYKCSWCGETVKGGVDRCPHCKFPYITKTHVSNIKLEMATKLDSGFSNEEILSQILRNQINIMQYIGQQYDDEWVVKRLLDDDITRTEYMRTYLNERDYGRV